MKTPSDTGSEGESAIVFDISPQLEAELVRRAREKGSDLSSEAAEILEDHVREAGQID